MSDDRDDIGSAGKSVALEQRGTGEDGRRYSPSAARNREPIAEVFARVMPLDGRVLEIASGTGEHGAWMTERFGALRWIYSDLDEMSRDSQRAWVRLAASGDRLAGPYAIDASSDDWGAAEHLAPLDGIFCANMIHIAPFEAAEGLLRGRLTLPHLEHGELDLPLSYQLAALRELLRQYVLLPRRLRNGNPDRGAHRLDVFTDRIGQC